ncbi:hydroxylamine reductase [Sorangium sp. So ce1036]|uniref:hydroxylamine reductase n=1 Tax=Sorangium sp. So ce1036 TaxID=3133328 RepID=UPI003F5271FE
MFCNQCEQTSHGTGCTTVGVCGKDEDVQSLQEILLYGLKGVAAYAHHARKLGVRDERVSAFLEEALFATLTNVNFDPEALLDLCLECGRVNLDVMAMLDQGHRLRFGEPQPAMVREGTVAGPGILVSGHDLADLSELLRQCEGTGVNVYTHGEMLPAHAYPRLAQHPNLAGHYGSAWQNQKAEFPAFTGPILMTSNCVLLPREAYRDRLFTAGPTAVPGGRRVQGSDFSEVIRMALSCPPLPDRFVRETEVGYHHEAILAHAGAIVSAVKAGQISRFFLIGGCDGPEAARSYYTEYAAQAPADSFILTLGCGKFRIRNHDHGTHLGLPRLLDMGQCNDAYGAIRVASALAAALGCGVNDLPLTLVISWLEQKAVAVLLTLLSLGVKGVVLGPRLPGFVSPNVLRLLQERYDLRLIGEAASADLLTLRRAPASACA